MENHFIYQNKSLVSLDDYSIDMLNECLKLAETFKGYRSKNKPHEFLKGKSIGLIFEKPSTRTRIAFSIAANELGMNAHVFNITDIQLGKKESVYDTAKFFERMFHGVCYRGSNHEVVELFASSGNIPIWNALTDLYHPTQLLADLLTIKEKFGDLTNAKILYIGDGRNNMANTWLIAAGIFGLDLVICTPKSLYPPLEVIERSNTLAKKSVGKILITDKIHTWLKDRNVVYTDVWFSMGEDDEAEHRIQLLREYQVNAALMEQTAEDSVFMHCLPAFHDIHTSVSMEMYKTFGENAFEVSDEVFKSQRSIVFDQAENRLHTIKALLYFSLCENTSVFGNSKLHQISI